MSRSVTVRADFGLQMLQIETFRRDASRYTEGVDRVSNLTHTSKV